MTDNNSESNFNMGISHLMRIDNLLNYLVGISSCCSSPFLNKDYPELGYSRGEKAPIDEWLNAISMLGREVDFLYTDGETTKDQELNNDSAKAIQEWIEDEQNTGKFGKARDLIIAYEKWTKKQLVNRNMLMSFKKDQTKAIVEL